MELWFLGTSAGRPIQERNVTSIALLMPQDRGTFWLIDCGEGTQHQLLRTPLRLSRLERILITHLHGDHVFGLPGLLSSRSSLGGSEPLAVHGPKGIAELLATAFRISGTHLDYELTVHEIEPGVVLSEHGMLVETALLDHRIDSYGYRIVESACPGPLDAARLRELGVPSGPLYGRLKAGEDIRLDDGRTIRSADVTGPTIPGRIVTVLGDTRPSANAVRLAQGADVLVHEATFDLALADKARDYGHSTTVQAAEAAREAGAGKLLITHFSTRYGEDDLAALEQEARTVFPLTEAARQLLPYPIPKKRK